MGDLHGVPAGALLWPGLVLAVCGHLGSKLVNEQCQSLVSFPFKCKQHITHTCSPVTEE